jgi:hypothetical protein
MPRVLLALLLLLLTVMPTAAQDDPAPPPGGWPNDIPCGRMESLLFHVHAHLAVFVDGQPYEVPMGIGIGQPWDTVDGSIGPFITRGSCFSWLHTHTIDGILHIEAPVPRTFTLGDFFAVWGQPLSSSQMAGIAGPVVAYVDGVRVNGDPADVVLTDLEVIQLNVGVDAPSPQPYTFPTRYTGE